jgi:hypothetical protein
LGWFKRGELWRTKGREKKMRQGVLKKSRRVGGTYSTKLKVFVLIYHIF